MNEQKTEPTNFEHVKGPFYIVRTQAGFRNALKHWGADKNMRLAGFPESYPSLVCFSTDYSGYLFNRADCVHVNRMNAALQPHLLENCEDKPETTPLSAVPIPTTPVKFDKA